MRSITCWCVRNELEVGTRRGEKREVKAGRGPRATGLESTMVTGRENLVLAR